MGIAVLTYFVASNVSPSHIAYNPHLKLKRRVRILRAAWRVKAVAGCAALAMLSCGAGAQSQAATGDPAVKTQPVEPVYREPSQQQKRNNYLLEAFGPYPLMWTPLVAGLHQATRTPPEWREGWPGYGQRYASDFGNSAVNISTRFSLAEALHEDTLYYRCACRGMWPRVKHAVVWTALAHRGADGHMAIAIPAIVAPYVASTVSVYGWYPRRYGAKDAFRMGNYGVLDYLAGNISLEFLSPFLHAKRSGWIARLHLDNRHLAPERVGGQ